MLRPKHDRAQALLSTTGQLWEEWIGQIKWPHITTPTVCQSTKWWIKVFYRLTMIAAMNSWIIKTNDRIKRPFIDFLVEIVRGLADHARQLKKINTKEPPKKKIKTNQGKGASSARLPKRRNTHNDCGSCNVSIVLRLIIQSNR